MGVTCIVCGKKISGGTLCASCESLGNTGVEIHILDLFEKPIIGQRINANCGAEVSF